jgi:hypothetical protein
MEFTAQFFEEASTAWRANKIALENGMFKYKKNEETSFVPNAINLHEVPGLINENATYGRTRSGKKYKKSENRSESEK